MKRIVFLLLIVTLFALVSCAQNVSPDLHIVPEEIPAEPQEIVQEEEAEYLFENTICAEESFLLDSGEVMGYYTYALPQMSIGNEDRLSKEERTAALSRAETFNSRMRDVLEAAVRYGNEMLADHKLLVEEENGPFVVCDELSSTVCRSGQIISVVTQCYYYGGGVHPYSYTVTYTFDLALGQFIDPAQIGDDPESFRTAAAELLIEHAESLGEDYTEGFWADYGDIISRWNETAVIFDENGMTVIFSAYELGPYAMGPVELTLSYEELANVIGDGGLAHLGVMNEIQ